MKFKITYGKEEPLSLDLDKKTTLNELCRLLAAHFNLAPETIKLLIPGIMSKKMIPLAGQRATLEEVGIKDGATKLKIMGSSAEAVSTVKQAKDLPGMASFEHEAQRAANRSSPAPTSIGPPSATYTFSKFEVWNQPGLTPSPSQALKLLHQLAADPGILAVMNKYKWRVGLLSEMPPAGKVGISPVCLLGVNVNKGQEISLRLRTDDLLGFRKYDKIRETLVHELAHMVYGDHDNDFKALNSQLRKEVDMFDWKNNAGAQSVSGGGPSYSGPTLGVPQPSTTAVPQQRTVGGAAKSSGDARQAAAAAALQRAGQPSSVQVAQQQHGNKPPKPLYKKGEYVSYRQRDGTHAMVQVVSVDESIIPPSYGIKLSSDSDGYRETEESRLQPLPAEDMSAPIEGLGHVDAATKAKEDEVRKLLET